MERIDQELSIAAAGVLESGVGDHAPELRSRLRQLPIQLHNSGLAATYAFLAARSNTASSDRLQSAYVEITQRVRERLVQMELVDESLASLPLSAVHSRTLDALGRMDVANYAMAGREVGLLFMWLRRLGEATLPQTEPHVEED